MISGIISASGFSKRMKREKLLIRLGGVTLIERAINAAFSSSCIDEVVIVYRIPALLQATDYRNAICVHNNMAEKGQSAAIKCGLKVCNAKADAFLFMVGDQPFLDNRTIDTIVDCHIRSSDKIIVPLYDEKKGTPVLFPSRFKKELENIKGDKGGSGIIATYPDSVKFISIHPSYIGIDIDNETDLKKAEAIINTR